MWDMSNETVPGGFANGCDPIEALGRTFYPCRFPLPTSSYAGTGRRQRSFASIGIVVVNVVRRGQ
jgi:hypothetical protein